MIRAAVRVEDSMQSIIGFLVGEGDGYIGDLEVINLAAFVSDEAP